MKRLALGLQAFFTLLAIAVLLFMWYSMITQGWMEGRNFFSWGNLYANTYMFIQLNILLIPVVVITSWRLLQMLGAAPVYPGVRFTNNVLVFIGVACFGVALYNMDLLSAAQGPRLPTPPSDANLAFPELPLPDATEEAPWEFTRLNGDAVTMADFEGKAIFLNFWATWCGFCIAEFPNIQRLYDGFKDEGSIAFILMTNEDRGTIEKWLATEEGSKYDFPIYLTESIPAQYEPTGWPTTFFIAPDGRTAFRHSGMVAWDGENTRNFLRELAATGK